MHCRAGANGTAATAMAIPLFVRDVRSTSGNPPERPCCVAIAFGVANKSIGGCRCDSIKSTRTRVKALASGGCSCLVYGEFFSEDVYDVPNEPFQPTHISFPPKEFGKSSPVRRTFQASWFNRYKWLHYDLGQDTAYCFICCKAVKERKVQLSFKTEKSFLANDFTNWKDATRIFSRHEICLILRSKLAINKPGEEYNRQDV